MKRTFARLFVIAAVTLLPVEQASAGMREDCLQNQDQERRIDGCTRVIESGQWKGADLVWAYNNRGLALASRNQHARAIADYDRALRLAPNNAAVLDNRGNSYAMIGNLEQALIDHNRAVELEPDDPRRWNNRAADHMDRGDYRAALKDLNTAVRLDANYGDAFKNRAYVRCWLGMDYAAAEDWLETLRTGRVTPEALQRELRSGGHYGGKIDGIFGSGSKAALRAWTEAGCK